MAHWYDKYLKKSKSDSHYSFWADEFEFDYDSDSVKSAMSESQIDTLKKYRLSSARKAISNFVTIATGKSIPVRFSNSSQSYTDGKSVVLSGDIDDSTKFDVGVGLALHEGSHVLLSDFEFLVNLPTSITKEMQDKGYKVGIPGPIAYIKDILNVVEDRRIDNYIYKSAPGYREYYLKLYEKYFGSKLITETLQSDEWNEETAENYMNRLINIMNPASDLVTLKGMRKIWNVLDINNIGRLKSTKDSFEVAKQIYDIICDSLQPKPFKKDDGKGEQQSGDGEGDGDGQSNGQQQDGDSDQRHGSSPINMRGDGNDSSSGGSAVDSSGEGSEEGEGQASTKAGKQSSKGSSLSNAKKAKMNKLMKEIKDFLNGKTKKKKLSAQMLKEIEAVEASGAELVHVADNFTNGRVQSKGVDVVVYKTLTKKMLQDKVVNLAEVHYKTKELNPVLSDDQVSTAERMGILMGKKLQVRNEARTTVFNRQRNGKIDKRLVHSLGFGAESVFTQLHIDKFKKANIHLSLDASSSMGGSKWRQTMINALALAKAVSMIPNLSLQISVRNSDEQLPIVTIIYDSRKDSYQKAKSLIPYLQAYGTTPEGLCFEAIHKLLVPATNDMDSYFVNISDGEPCFNNRSIDYSGYSAWDHTKKEVEKIRKEGIGVLSYFVAERRLPSHEPFQRMYGKDSRFIDINSVTDVSKTLNKMFLTKEAA
jgi:hypothetical protein